MTCQEAKIVLQNHEAHVAGSTTCSRKTIVGGCGGARDQVVDGGCWTGDFLDVDVFGGVAMGEAVGRNAKPVMKAFDFFETPLRSRSTP